MTPTQRAAIARVLDNEPRIAFGLVFGSTARGQAHAGSDLDLAVGVARDIPFEPLAIGGLVSDLERATQRTVDVVLLREAPPALAYRIFRDGEAVFVRNRPAMIERRVQAVMDYLDYRPFESAFVRGVLHPRG